MTSRLHTEVVDAGAPLEALADDWNRLIRADNTTITGHDATSSFLWFQTLRAAFSKAAPTRLIVVREGDTIVAMMAVAPEPGGSLCRTLFVPTMLYGGRNGLMLAQPRVDLAAALLDGLSQAFGPWRAIRLAMVDGSAAARLLALACKAGGYTIVADKVPMASPHFPLGPDADAFASRMSKSLKQTLRTSANKFRALGTLAIEEIGDASAAGAAIETILEIERGSWKHDAGSAITRRPDQESFYRELFARATGSGLLYGLVARLNGQPIAYNFGLIQGGAYSCLKLSQVSEFQHLSPGQLLNLTLIDRLRERGVITYDFMGKPEPYKLRWSDDVALYSVRPLWVYSAGLCGRAGLTLHRLKDMLRRARARVIKPDMSNGDSAADPSSGNPS